MLRWFLAVACGGTVLWSQPPQPQNWTVTGTVTDSLTARPISGAVVMWEPSFAALGFRDRPIESDEPSANAARAITDGSGAFTLAVDPTATGVRLFVSHAGYRAEDGKPRAAVAVRNGSPPVVIRLTPQSSIQGRVTNAAGEALGGIAVSLARVEIRDGRRQARQTSEKITAPDGTFLFDDLIPGVFSLRAAGQAGGKTYGPAYYPAAFTQDQAQLLRAAAGKAVIANFRLESHASFRIRGIVTNMPLRRSVTIRLLRGGDPLGNAAAVSPNGTFEVSGVGPGAYTVQAYTPDVVPLNLGEAEVTVEDRDPIGVKIAMSEGRDIPGHIEFRGPGSLEAYAVVYATPFYPRRWPGEVKDAVAVMNTRGNFVLKNLQPGKYEISVRGLLNFYLAEIHANFTSGPQDILEQGLTVPVENPPSLAIVMKSGAAEITGSIEGANPGDLFSVAVILQRGGVPIPAVLRAPDGRFHITGLAPGDYTLLAWPDSREVEYRNAAVLAGLLPQGTAISLAEGARRSALLTPVP